MKVSTPAEAYRGGVQRPRSLLGTRLGQFRQALLEWYGPRARPLRIRGTREPWAILVSEVMAQQTQIARVDEAWTTFMARYPRPRDLARAPTAEVLRAWAGLGYNRRALNLQRAAAAIEADHDGRVPDELEALEALPGVGPYTARAVAAIAFGRPVAAVDTNVRRVVTRVAGQSLAPRELQAEADALVPPADPATWTHASMELGATVCVARRPRCAECPLRAWCASVDRVEDVPRRGRSEPPFEQTTRWLRGRIVARLRDLDDGRWERLPGELGDHDEAAIAVAVAGLERDGLLERRPDGAVRLPSGST
jgi:A/G-specific adenine glycosylase